MWWNAQHQRGVEARASQAERVAAHSRELAGVRAPGEAQVVRGDVTPV
jgi:hypothetical protein